MKCFICNNEEIEITYEGYIRDGRVGKLTKMKVPMYKCKNCLTIWHDDLEKDLEKYYQSEEYRKDLEGTSEIEDFYKMHDCESMEKFRYTGTEIFRNKVVADIGCGGGAFLDYIATVAKEVIAIEPSLKYQEELKKRGYKVYSYASDALKEWADGIDVIVSFDCIEHVRNPIEFIQEAYELLREGGRAIIGTPTDAPVMREVLGQEYEAFLFSTQHPWVLSKEGLEEIARKCGITQCKVNHYQRYGIGNFISWLINKAPKGNIMYDFISNTLDGVWKTELERQELADYIVLDFKK